MKFIEAIIKTIYVAKYLALFELTITFESLSVIP